MLPPMVSCAARRGWGRLGRSAAGGPGPRGRAEARLPLALVLVTSAILGCGDPSKTTSRDGGLDAASPVPGTDAGETTAMDAGAAASDAGRGPDAAIVDADPGPDGGPGPLFFEDITLAAGLDFERVPTNEYRSIPDRMTGGVCVLDADGAEGLDLFFALRPSTSGGARLYMSTGRLTYRDETGARGLAVVGDASACLAFDADGDGDDDLLISGLGTLRLFLNQDGVFVDESARLGFVPDPRDLYMSAAAGDLDGDGDLDLVVAGFARYDPSRYMPDEICAELICTAHVFFYDYIPDLLLLRQSDGTYRESSATLAPALREAEPGLMVAIGDLNEDHLADIYVGNDIGHAFRDRPLVRGRDGRFVDDSEHVGLAYNYRGYGIDTMGWSSADVDGNGRVDHVATSFEADPTAVFLCMDDGFCEDRGPDLGTRDLAFSFRWGPALADFDLDGDPDLLEATGHFHSDLEVRDFGFRRGLQQRPNLLENLGGGELRPHQPRTDDGLSVERAARGIAIADLDDDGRPDAVFAPAVGRPLLLHNVRDPQGHYLRVRLVGVSPNTGAVGARVTVRGARRSVFRDRTVGEGYLGNFDPRLLFGIDEPGPVAVQVRWPNGRLSNHDAVDLDREIVIVEPRR